MLDGQSMCNTCRLKNKRVGDCDGCFSVLEFDSLQAQREKMMQDVEEKDREVRRLLDTLRQAAEALGQASAAVSRAQQQKDHLQKSVDRLRDVQHQMLSREMGALDAIDEASSDEPSAQFAFALDSAFVPSLQQMVDFSGGTVAPESVGGVR